VALPGAVLPGGRGIAVTTIAGSESQGMLCSGAELGLTTDAEAALLTLEKGAPTHLSAWHATQATLAGRPPIRSDTPKDLDIPLP